MHAHAVDVKLGVRSQTELGCSTADNPVHLVHEVVGAMSLWNAGSTSTAQKLSDAKAAKYASMLELNISSADAKDVSLSDKLLSQTCRKALIRAADSTQRENSRPRLRWST